MISYRHGERNTNLKGIDMNYYVSSGAKNKMYTLRVRFTETVWMGNAFGSRLVERDQHVASLATDKERAINKAHQMVGKNLKIGFEVGEIKKGQRREYEPNVFRFGKYVGKTVEEIKEIDPKYLMWVADNFTSKKHQDVIDFVKKSIAVELEERASEFVKELEAEKQKELDRSVYLKDIGETLVTLPWDFPQNIGKDLIKGQLPKGRGRHLVCDMMGKIQGRRNSKKYKAEYQRVEDMIGKAEAI